MQSKAATHAWADTIILSNTALTYLAVHAFIRRNWSCIVHNHHMELKTWSDLCGMLPESAAFSAQKLIPLTIRTTLQTKHAEKRAGWRLHNSWKCDENTKTAHQTGPEPQKRLTVCKDCSDAISAPMLSVSSHQKHTNFACISMQQSEIQHTDRRSLKNRSIFKIIINECSSSELEWWRAATFTTQNNTIGSAACAVCS